MDGIGFYPGGGDAAAEHIRPANVILVIKGVINVYSIVVGW